MPGTSLVGYSPYFRLGELVLTLRLALGITILSKSTAHGHSPEDLASELFNIACPACPVGLNDRTGVKSCLLLFNWGQ